MLTFQTISQKLKLAEAIRYTLARWEGFPHARRPGERERPVIWPANIWPLREKDHLGRDRHWILEIHLVDQGRTFGGFHEQLI